jgi:molybdopterin-biosynthesis enzyme MoeA-like protein
MIEWVLDTHHRPLHRATVVRERSVIVFGAMEAALTPLMEDIEARFPGVKVFSLPSVDHPQHGRHIELGVKPAQPGQPGQGDDAAAFAALRQGLIDFGASLGPEMVR